jgi:integrase
MGASQGASASATRTVNIPLRRGLQVVATGAAPHSTGGFMYEHDSEAIAEFITDMRIAKLSPTTISDRTDVLLRLARHLADIPLIHADPTDLRNYQATYAHLMPATVDIYTRHIKAFYQWTAARGRTSIDPAAHLVLPRRRRGKPHPISNDDLRTLLACTRGYLRLVYVLAAFAGLRRAEICRAEAHHIDYEAPARLLVLGKGEAERYAPLLAPVVDELYEQGNRRSWLITDDKQRPLDPKKLSITSYYHMAGLGIPSTIHSLRHFYLTNAFRATKDPLFVRDLAGHTSVATTEIYMDSTLDGAHERLEAVAGTARSMLTARHLKVVD